MVFHVKDHIRSKLLLFGALLGAGLAFPAGVLAQTAGSAGPALGAAGVAPERDRRTRPPPPPPPTICKRSS